MLVWKLVFATFGRSHMHKVSFLAVKTAVFSVYDFLSLCKRNRFDN